MARYSQSNKATATASRSGGRSSVRWALWVSLALIAINLVVFAPVRQFDFVSWDDPLYITENTNVASGLTWQGVWWALTTGYRYYWHPLTWLSHMLDVEIYGLRAGGHHLTNLLLHAVTTLLLFGLLRRMTGAVGRSAFVAALFAVHPLHVESVAWVAERKDVLSGLFWMLTLWAYVWYVRAPRPGRYLVVLLLFGLGLMAKPMIVTLPLVLLLLDVWPLCRVPGGGVPWSDPQSVPLPGRWPVVLKLVGEKLPLVALAALSSAVTVVNQLQAGAVRGIGKFPLDFRVTNAVLSYAAYVGKMVWPARLAAFYPYPQSLPGLWAIVALLGLVLVSVGAVRAARRRPYLIVGWLWYLVTLLPVIGLVQVGDQALADRFTYIPLIGLFLVVAWGIPDLLARWPHRRTLLPALAGLVVLGCAVTARAQLQHWRNSLTLWEHAAEVTTDNQRAHANLGAALASEGRIGEAIEHYSEAVRIVPDAADLHNHLGMLLKQQGRTAEALTELSLAVRLEPDYAVARNNLGVALAEHGRLDEGIRECREAVRLDPNYAQAHNNLGKMLEMRGRTDEAIAHYSEALRLKPDYAIAHGNLGIALAAQGRLDEAIRECREAVRLDPGYAEAHNNLGRMLETQGRVSEAIAHYSEAVRLKPEFGMARVNLGLALAKTGRANEAIQQLTEALRIDPGNQAARQAVDELTTRDKRF